MPEYEIKNEVKAYEDLRALMEKSGHEFDYGLIDRAYHVADEAHKGQVRNSGDPYIVHPLAVACILVELGMDPARIWMEDKSTSTWENLHFSLALIEEKTGSRPEQIGLVSSAYHLFRGRLFAKKWGAEAVAIPAKTGNPLHFLNAFLREIAGVWHYLILGG